MTVTDDFGEVVTIHGVPQRIVSLAPSNTEILYALGLENRIVGVTDYCNYPPAASDVPKVGGYSTISIERVLAADPDLVFAAMGNTEDVVNHLRSLGLTIVSLNPETIDDVLYDVELLGRATGQAEQAAACEEPGLASGSNRRPKVPENPRLPMLSGMIPSGSVAGTFQDEVIRMAGGPRVRFCRGWGIVGLEEFITRT